MAELHPDLFHVNLSSFPVIDLEVATEEGDASMSIHPRSQPSTSRLWLWWPVRKAVCSNRGRQEGCERADNIMCHPSLVFLPRCAVIVRHFDAHHVSPLGRLRRAWGRRRALLCHACRERRRS
ncbi:Os02g0512800 [Oryza sativa Japonica Group]|uniref:Os02g0512800 protein n=1 Tax=Oryza sativa subsp. japonica TaxID=39947 RepID=A0A0P0VJG2_ORYSJ|nr:Os02g0512800 [Oryza sativa Japonica Group]